ncbi:MAG: hypothetical protein JW894_12180 [Bacteroidales bacterium]|nr:hypothetical protein [Bacteroidales bacterium]
MNILKKYPELLELAYLSVVERTKSLKSIFERDIENDPNLNFRKKKIYPIKGEEPAMQLLFNHLTREEVEEEDESGRKVKRRVFDMHRSQRLHWVKYHIEENKKDKMEIFSTEERVKGKTVFRTYIFDLAEKYVIVLEPQRTKKDYYLLTAFYLYKKHGETQIKNKLKNKLGEIL